MVTEKPNVKDDALYSQKEAAEALGISRSTIRRYAVSGCIRFKTRKANMRPVVTGAEIIKCWRSVYF